MLEGLPYVAILLLLLLLFLVLFLILLFIFLLCASRLSTRQSKVDGTLGHPWSVNVSPCTIIQEARGLVPSHSRKGVIDRCPNEHQTAPRMNRNNLAITMTRIVCTSVACTDPWLDAISPFDGVLSCYCSARKERQVEKPSWPAISGKS